MTYGSKTSGYPALSKWLHWLIAAAVLTAVPVAIAMGRVGPGPTQDALYNLHKSLGVLILVLMIGRLVNRIVAGAPRPEPGIPTWQRYVSSAVHTLFYVLLIGLPVVGYVANSAFGATTPFFGLFDLPPIIAKDDALAEWLFTQHRRVGIFLTGLIIVHIAAALFHHLVRGDNVLRRMLPRAAGGS